MNYDNTYWGKRVLVTGDTGFKGSWLCEWLLSLGAEVFGIGLEPNTTPSLFEELKLSQRIHHRICDIRDASAVEAYILEIQPDIILHLAAQPLVRLSYAIPVETYATNVMGTVHVLNALRLLTKNCAAVFITTDKCYENRECSHSYREDDRLGGHDPYSSSKGACEIAIQSFRNSYFSDPDECGVAIASARAGNVVGGGDWASDRIIPDCIRALKKEEAIPVRSKMATRPWQHVLEPLGGYLRLAAELWRGLHGEKQLYTDFRYTKLCDAFNFGPLLASNRPVGELVDAVLKLWPGESVDFSDPNAVHEASLLNLSIDKAYHVLKWSPIWDFEMTISQTIDWYRTEHSNAADVLSKTQAQIKTYSAMLS
ncbi:MAG: CDP-glucose 4,6-dehydratase [Lentimonas sp.]